MNHHPARSDFVPPAALSLVHQVRRFGPYGILYEVLSVVDAENVHILVIETGEKLDYPITSVLDDPVD